MANLRIDAAGLTNALTDVTIRVSEEELKDLGIEKSRGRSLRNLDQNKLSKISSKRDQQVSCAGSPANTIINLNYMNRNTALLGTLGEDKLADNYEAYLARLGVKSLLGRIPGNSGLCYILLTPDNERTSVADLGVAGAFRYSLEKLPASKVFHTSGYEVVTNPSRAIETLRYAKLLGSKISFDLADPKMIKKERLAIEKVIELSDILFMTEEEAEELTFKDPLTALKLMSQSIDFVCLKKGARGSIVKRSDEEYYIPIFPVKLASTCGAGDAYASGFLYGYLNGFKLQDAGLVASKIASLVCSLESSHLTEKIENPENQLS